MKLVFYHGTNLVSRAIQWVTRGWWNHVAILDDAEDTLYEAREIHRDASGRFASGVTRYPWRPLDLAGEARSVFSLRPGIGLDETAVRRFMQGELGCPYDYLMVLRFLSRRGPSRGSERKWFCSEFAYEAFRRGGVELFRGTRAYEVDPERLSRSPLLVVQPTPAMHAAPETVLASSRLSQ